MLQAQRVVEQAALTFNKKEHLRYQSLESSAAASISLVDSIWFALQESEANQKRLSAEISHAPVRAEN